MSETKPPAFQFYAADFLTDTMAMPVDAKGVYITLLCYAWINGSIPESTYSLARICGLSRDEIDEHMLWLGEKFIENPERKGTRVNPRLEAERHKQHAFRQQRVEAGKRSGERRRTSVPTGSQREGNSTSTSTSTIKKAHPSGESHQADAFGDTTTPVPNSVPIQKIVELYHEHCPDSPRVRVLTEKRKKVIRARWRADKKYQNLKWWAGFFIYINKDCPFMVGKNDKGWIANIDFIMRESGFVGIIEGKYEGKKNGT